MCRVVSAPSFVAEQVRVVAHQGKLFHGVTEGRCHSLAGEPRLPDRGCAFLEEFGC